MKKQLCYLLAMFSLLTVGKASADVALDFKPTDAGYEAGAFNKIEQSQINNFQIEKSYIHSLDHITKDESIYDASIEENVAREGILYNPHYLL